MKRLVMMAIIVLAGLASHAQTRTKEYNNGTKIEYKVKESGLKVVTMFFKAELIEQQSDFIVLFGVDEMYKFIGATLDALDVKEFNKTILNKDNKHIATIIRSKLDPNMTYIIGHRTGTGKFNEKDLVAILTDIVDFAKK